ncbi:hypothetical protein Aduo_001329 [Ancylostoma duodenale]
MVGVRSYLQIRALRKKLEKNDDEAPATEANRTMTNGTPSPARSSSEMSTTPEKSDKTTPEKQTEKPTRPSLGRGLPSNGVEQNAGTSNSSTPERKTADEAENSSISDLRKKLMESSESTSGINGERKSSVSSRVSSSRKSLTPDRRLDPIYEVSHLMVVALSSILLLTRKAHGEKLLTLSCHDKTYMGRELLGP